jgi:hypothetical protein
VSDRSVVPTTGERATEMYDANPTRLTYDTITHVMLERVPDLSQAYQFAVFNDCLAVTVFLGNVADHVLEQTRALVNLPEEQRLATEARLSAIFEIIEDGLDPDDSKLFGAISAGFIEELDMDDAELFQQVLERLGPKARERVRVLTEFYHSKEWIDFLKEQK